MDPLTRVTQAPNLQQLFGGRTAPATPFAEVHAAAVASADAPQRPEIDGSRLEAWEGMFYDPATGEGIVGQETEPGKWSYLHTGWFFERPMQHQPTPGGSLEDRSYLVPVSRFGFLTEESTNRLMDLLAPHLPPDARIVGSGFAEANPSFPYTSPQREIVVSANGNTIRLPAGALAREMCNYTYRDENGAVKQHQTATITRALAQWQIAG